MQDETLCSPNPFTPLQTESTKIIMQYLATVGRSKTDRAMDMHAGSEGASARPSVERRVLAANPIFESFGNAKTVRNENSSRFGRFCRLLWNSRGELLGATVDTYLLEKVRLVNQAKGERNYHVFYQVGKRGVGGGGGVVCGLRGATCSVGCVSCDTKPGCGAVLFRAHVHGCRCGVGGLGGDVRAGVRSWSWRGR